MNSRLLRLITLIATFLGLLAGFGTSASAQTTAHSPGSGAFKDDITYRQIVARHSEKCVTVRGGSRHDGAAAVQETCEEDRASQQWHVIPLGDGYYQIRNRRSEKCLTVLGSLHNEGADIVQWRCRNEKNQQWHPIQLDEGYFELQARHSDKCLTVRGGTHADGAPLIQRSCHERNYQQWFGQVVEEPDES